VQLRPTDHIAELAVLVRALSCDHVLNDVAVQIEDQFACLLGQAQVLKLQEGFKEVKHVGHAFVRELVASWCITVASGILNSVDGADEAVEQALSQCVEVLLLLDGQGEVDRLETDLASTDQNLHGFAEVWLEGLLSHEADVSSSGYTKDLDLSLDVLFLKDYEQKLHDGVEVWQHLLLHGVGKVLDQSCRPSFGVDVKGVGLAITTSVLDGRVNYIDDRFLDAAKLVFV